MGPVGTLVSRSEASGLLVGPGNAGATTLLPGCSRAAVRPRAAQRGGAERPRELDASPPARGSAAATAATLSQRVRPETGPRRAYRTRHRDSGRPCPCRREGAGPGYPRHVQHRLGAEREPAAAGEPTLPPSAGAIDRGSLPFSARCGSEPKGVADVTRRPRNVGRELTQFSRDVQLEQLPLTTVPSAPDPLGRAWTKLSVNACTRAASTRTRGCR